MLFKFYFYEGSYQFHEVETDTLDYLPIIMYQLTKQHVYRPTKESLWATVHLHNQDGTYKEIERFLLVNGDSLMKFNYKTSQYTECVLKDE